MDQLLLIVEVPSELEFNMSAINLKYSTLAFKSISCKSSSTPDKKSALIQRLKTFSGWAYKKLRQTSSSYNAYASKEG